MKRFFFTAAALLIAGLALQAQDFDKAWKDSEFAAKFGTDLYNGAVRPIWTGEDTFVFETLDGHHLVHHAHLLCLTRRILTAEEPYLTCLLLTNDTCEV